MVYIQADEGGLVCHQRACALYVITALAVDGIKRARACMWFICRLDYIQPSGLITYRSPSGLHPRLRRVQEAGSCDVFE